MSLVLFSALLGFNQVVIKFVNDGLQPIFFCGVRSILAVGFIYLWMRYKKIPIIIKVANLKNGILAGFAFSAQFFCLFLALDFTSVIRTSIIYYSMPIWVTILSHFIIPNDKISSLKVLGLLVAFCGLILVFLSIDSSNLSSSMVGDFFALAGAISWALIIIIAKGTSFSDEVPEMQLLWMVSVSGIVLLLLAPIYGPLIRDFQTIHLAGLLFQSLVVVSGSFILWLWLLTIYPASSVASFAFLTPLFGILFGYFLLNEALHPHTLFAGLIVFFGVFLLNSSTK